MAACNPGLGGIQVTVTNTAGTAISDSVVTFSFQNPSLPGSYFTVNRNSDSAGQACLSHGPIGGETDVDDVRVAFGLADSNDLSQSLDVMATTTGFLTGCSSTTNIQTPGNCKTLFGGIVYSNASNPNAVAASGITTQVAITAQRGSDASAVNFGSAATRLTELTFNGETLTSANLGTARLFVSNSTTIYYAPSNPGTAMVTLKYQGFVDEVTAGTINPSATGNQESAAFTGADALKETLQIPINTTTDITDELANFLGSGASITVFHVSNLTTFDPASGTGAAAAALYAPKIAANVAYVEAYATGGTPTVRANLPNYVNNDVEVALTPAAAAVSMNLSQSAGACAPAANDGCGFKHPLKVVFEDELGNALSPSAFAAALTFAGNAITVSDGVNTAYWAYETTGALVAQSNGYVDPNTTHANNLNSFTIADTQQMTLTFQSGAGVLGGAPTGAGTTLAGIQFSKKATFADELGNTLTPSSVTGGSSAAACTLSGATAYCPVLLADDDSGENILWMLDGYVSGSETVGGSNNRTLHTDAQTTVTLTNIDFSKKVTFTDELGSTISPLSFSGVTAGTSNVTCQLSSSAAYCAVVLADDDGGENIVAGIDGYDSDSGATGGANNRTLSNDAQTVVTFDNLQYAKVITFTDELGSAISPLSFSSVTAGASNASCTLSTSAAYCPVLIADDNAGENIVTTIVGYDTDSGATGGTANRTATTDAQTVLTYTGMTFAKKVTFTDELGNAISPLSFSSVTAGASNATCTLSTSAAYCLVAIGDDNAGENIVATFDGYDADSGTANGATNRTATTDAQTVITYDNIQFSKKITFTDELTNTLSPLSFSAVTAGSSNTSCTLSSSAAYCPVPVADDNGGANILADIDGYDADSGATGGATNRTGQTDAQTVLTYTGIQFAQKITFADELGGTLTPSAVNAGDNATACVLSGATAYCPVPIADDNVSPNPVAWTLTGFVSGSETVGGTADRTLTSSAQTVLTLTNIDFSKVITFTEELSNALSPLSFSSVTAGGSAASCTLSSSGAYCPVAIGDDTPENIVATIDGFDIDSGTTGGSTDRTAVTDPQTALTYTGISFSKKVMFTDELGGSITPSAVTAGGTNVTCVISGADAYCPTPLAQDDGGENIQTTLDGYVAGSGSASGAANRVAHTDAQSVITQTGIQFSKKITFTEELTNTLSPLSFSSVTAGSSNVTCTLSSSAAYCPVVVADDNGGANIVATIDGFDSDSGATGGATNRTVQGDPQTALTYTGIQFAKKITFQSEITTPLTPSSVTAGANNTTCTISGGTAYCPVVIADDNAGENVIAVLDGYVSGSEAVGGAADRTATTDAQTVITFNNVQFSKVITAISREVDAAPLTPSAVTAGASNVVCQSNAGNWYCPVVLADDNGGANIVLSGIDGYDADSGTAGGANDRTLSTDAQTSLTVTNISFSKKIVASLRESDSGVLTPEVGTTAGAGNTTCIISGTEAYCPVPLAGDDVGDNVNVQVDGYVKGSGSTAGTTNRTAHTDAQTVLTQSAILFSKKIVSMTREGDSGALNPAAVTASAVSDTYLCVTGAGPTFYCPVPVGSDDAGSNFYLHAVGYDGDSGTASGDNNRTAQTDAQDIITISNISFSKKITVKREVDATQLTPTAATAGDATTTCVIIGMTAYCPVGVNEDETSPSQNVSITVDGYDADSGTEYIASGNADRTVISDSQTVVEVVDLSFSKKLTGVTREWDGGTLTITSATAGASAVTCLLNGSEAYCPVTVADDNVFSMSVIVDGYDSDSGTPAGWTNRTGQTDAQDTITISGLQFSKKIATFTREVDSATLSASVVAAWAGSGSTICIQAGAEWLCPVPLANDDGGENVDLQIDGYDGNSGSIGGAANRTAHTDAQTTLNITNIQFAKKITGFAREQDSSDISASVSELWSANSTVCVENANDWYCPTALNADDISEGIDFAADGYVGKSGTTNGVANRTAHSDSQTVLSQSGILFAKKYSVYNEAFVQQITPSAATAGSTNTTCVISGQDAYCPVPLANDNGGENAIATLDGYVQGTGNINGAVNRTAHSDSQTAFTLTDMQFSKKVVSVTREADNGNVTASLDNGTTAGASGVACMVSASAGYCPVLLADDDSGPNLSASVDGYVMGSGTQPAGFNRTLQTSAQTILTLTNLQFAKKITFTEELGNTIPALSFSTVTAGSSNTNCLLHASGTYCPVPLADDNGGENVVATLNGYVAGSGTAGGAVDRTLSTSAQTAVTLSGYQYSKKVTFTEELGNTLSPLSLSALTAGSSNVSCTLSSSAAYCPVVIADDNGGANLVLTLDGFDADSGTTNGATDRTAQTDAQTVLSVSSILYSKKVTFTDELGTTLSPLSFSAVTAGTSNASCTLSSSAAYCPVLVADDNGGANLTLTIDGFDSNSGATTGATNRTGNTDAQTVLTHDNIQYAKKITFTDELGTTLNPLSFSSVTAGASNASCVLSTSAAYCPVNIGDDTPENIIATIDGFDSDSGSATGATDRIATTDAQTVLAYDNIQYAKKITFTDELSTTLSPLSFSSVTAGASNTTCTLSSSAAYCPVPLADDNGGSNIVATLDGFDSDSGTAGGAADRTVGTDAQTVLTYTTIQFAKKVTFADELGGVLTPSAVTGGINATVCTISGATAYCPTPLADDNAGEEIRWTLTGYVSSSEVVGGAANRTANNDAQTVLTLTSIDFSKKVTFADELGGTLTPSAVTAGASAVACTLSGATAYCPVSIADDNGGELINPTLAGYVSGSETVGGAANRTTTADVQTVVTLTNFDFAKKVTFTEELGNALSPLSFSGVTAGSSNTTCTLSSSAAYCPVPITDDNGGANLTLTIDGFDSDSGATTGATDRTAVTNAQTVLTHDNIQFAKKITFAEELGNAINPLSFSSVTAGASNATCTLSSSAAYCPVNIADDNAGENVVATFDGYDADSGTETGAANRTATTDAQTVVAISNLQYAKKITFTEELGNTLSPLSFSSVTAGASNTTCTLSTSAAYCPVPIADDNAGENIVATLDGFDADSGTTGGAINRTAQTDAQTVLTYTSIQFSKKVTFTEELGTTMSPLSFSSVTAGASNASCILSTSAAYCPVLLADDNGGANLTLTIDGFDSDSGATVGATNRTAHTDAQTVLAHNTISYSKKVTFTEELSNPLTPSAVTAGASNTTCVISGGTAYCPVPIADDNAGENVIATLDGYVEGSGTSGGAANRTATTDAQTAITFSGISYSKKITFTDELGGGLTPSAVTAGASNVVCVISGNVAYCPVVVADDNAGENVIATLDGYDGDSGTSSGANNRTAQTDAQTVIMQTDVQFSKKITFTDEIGLAMSPLSFSSVTAGASNVTCSLSSSAAYCPVLLADDGGANENILATRDGWVLNSGTATNVVNRAAHTDAQTVMTYDGIDYAKKVVFTEELGNTMTHLSFSSVTAGTSNVSCTLSASAAYCPVALADDGATLPNQNVIETADGFQQGSGTLANTAGPNDRTTHASAQTQLSLTGLIYAKKITFADELGNSVNPDAVTAGASNASCVISASTAYCLTALADDNAGENITLTEAGFVTGSGTTTGATDRTVHTNAQTVLTYTDVDFAKKLTFSDELSNTLSPLSFSSVTAGSSNTTCQLSSSAAYCPVPITDDDLGENIEALLDGYVKGSGVPNGTANRTANTDAQTVISQSGLLFAKKITVTDELGNSLTPSAMTAGSNNTSCQISGNVAYCPVPIADDNSGENIVVTVAGFDADSGTTGGAADRTGFSSPQTVATQSGIQFSKKITMTDELGGALTPASVNAGANATACTVVSGTAYCPVPITDDNSATLEVAWSLDGYVSGSGVIGGSANRTAVTDSQTVMTVNTVSFSKKITFTDELAGGLTPSAVTAGSGNTTCTLSGNTAYCPVPLASDDGGENIIATLDGYVQGSGATTGNNNRTLSTDAQTVLTQDNIQFSKKITFTDELSNALNPLSFSSVTAGIVNSTCQLSSSAAYCPVPLVSDGGTENIIATIDGFDADSGTTGGATDRTTQNAAQTTLTYTGLKFAKKITFTDELTNGITPSAVTAGASNAACTMSGNTAYCPVQLADDNGGENVIATLDGYVQGTGATTGAANRTANTDAQTVLTHNNVQFAKKVTFADELGGTITPVAVTAGNSAVSCQINTSTAYCPVVVADDDAGEKVNANMLGYVSGSETVGGATDRVAQNSAQTVVTLTNIQFSKKVTFTDELGGGLTPSAVTAGASNATCTMSGNTAYCPVSFIDDNGGENVIATLDGYVQGSGTSAGATDRTAQNSAQTVLTHNSISFSKKITFSDELGGGLTPSAVTAGINNTTCQIMGAMAYCPVPVLDDGGTENIMVTVAGYVEGSGTPAGGANRSAQIDPQTSVTLSNVKFSKKITFQDELSNGLTPSAVTAGASNTTCIMSGNTAYCPVPITDDNGGENVIATLDGYVQGSGTSSGATNRTATTSAQTVIVQTSMLFSKKVAFTNELGGSITPTAATAGASNATCQMNAGWAYCPVVVADDNGGANLVFTLDGYVQGSGSTTGATDRTAQNDAQTVLSQSGVLFAKKVTFTDELTNNLTPSSVTAGSANTACTMNGATAYCPVPLANDDGGENVIATLDGYVQGTGATTGATNRTGHGDVQTVLTHNNIQFSKKINFTDELGANLTPSAVTAGIANTTCQIMGNMAYCPVPILDDGGTENIMATIPGYVEGSGSSGGAANRTAQNDPQSVINRNSIQFAKKITFQDELTNSLTPSAVTAGSANTTCIMSGNTAYCPVPITDDNGGENVIATLDGYVQGSGTSSGAADRTATTSGQTVIVQTSMLFSKKVAFTNELGGALTPTALTAGSSNTTCQISGSTGYCPVPLVDDDGGENLTPTTPGYVQGSGGLAGANNRTVQNDAQTSLTLSNVQFAKKITFTDELTNNLTPSSVTAGASNVVCTMNGATAYCPVVIADDNGGENVIATLDGYVQGSGATAGAADRTADTDAQTVLTHNNIQFSKKINFTDELSGNLTPSAVTAGANNTTCQIMGNMAYCPVPVLDDSASENIMATIPGYVEGSGSSVGGTNRTAQNNAQTVITRSNVQFAKKITFQDELTNSLTPSAVTAGASNTTCVMSGNTAYCPVPITDDNGGENVIATLDGYVEGSGTSSGATDRTATTSAQTVIVQTNMLFSKKATFSNELGTSITPTSVTAGASNAACQINSSTAYCPVLLADDNGGANLVFTLDGYVQGSGTTNGATDRTTQNAAQTVLSQSGVLFSKKVTFTDELTNNLTPSSVTAGSVNTVCTMNGATAYCPVPVGNDDAGENVIATLDGYVQASGATTGATNRANQNDAQTVLTHNNIQFSKKATFADELGGGLTPSAVTAGASNVACQLNGATAYCPVVVADDNAGENLVATLDGYVAGSGTSGGAANRTAQNDAQTVIAHSAVKFAKKITFTDELTNSLTPSAVTAGASNTACTMNGNTAYCPVPLADDNGGENVIATLDGYVQASGATTGATDRVAQTSAQTVLTHNNILFSKKVTFTDELGGGFNPTSVTAGASNVVCTINTGTAYCPVVVADDNAGENIVASMTGFVAGSGATAGAADRTAQTDAQTVITHSNVQYSKKITFTDELGASITPSAVTAGATNTACTMNGNTAYCPVAVANDNGGENITMTLDGYVQGSGTTGGATDRTATTDAQTVLTYTNVDFSKKITFQDELGGTLTPSAVTAGAANTTCTMNGATAYCPVPVNDDGGTENIMATIAGYVAGSGTATGGANRTAQTDAQSVVVLGGIDFSKKITFQNELGGTLTPSAVTAGASNVACTMNGNTAYCPVVIADDNGGENVAFTLDGYVQNSGATGGATDRTVVTNPQTVLTQTGILFSKKITFTDELGNAFNPTTVTAGTSNVVCQINAGTAYCPVLVADDNGGENIVASMTGFVAGSGATAGGNDRTAQNTAQTVITHSNVQYSKKITFTNELGTTLTPSAVTAGASNAACTLSGATAYCPVALGDDNGGENIVVTADGFDTDSGATGGATDRTAITDAQTTLTYTNVQFAKKVTFTDELGANLTPSAVTAGAGNTTCTLNGATAYCAVPIADDNGGENVLVTLAGFVTGSGSTGGAANRTVATDAQSVVTLSNIQFAKKITFIDELTNSLTPSSVTAGSSNTACTMNGNTAYCPVPTTDDNGGENVTFVLDGYVQSSGATGGAGDRTLASSPQTVLTQTGIKFAKKITFTDEIGNTFNPTSVTAGTNDTGCTINSGTAYCPVPVADDNGGENIVAVMTGFVAGSGTTSGGTDRVAQNSAQTVMTHSNISYSKKITFTDELGNNLTPSAVTAGTSNVTCTLVSGAAYCAVAVGDDDGGENINATLDGYVQGSGATGGGNNRTTISSSQTVITYTNVQFAKKATFSDELGNVLTPSAVTAGVNNTGCTLNGATAYCPVPLADDNAGENLLPSVTGFVQGSGSVGGAANRTAHTDAQSVLTQSGIQFNKKITFSREGDNAGITPSAVTAGASNTACTLSASTAYCPVPLADDDAGENIVASLTGYVAGSGTATGATNRTAVNTPQTVIALQSIKTSKKIVATTEAGAGYETPATMTAGASNTACYEAPPGYFYCPVPITDDDGGENVLHTKTGYVTNSGALSGSANRTATNDPQTSLTLSNVQFQLKLVVADDQGGSIAVNSTNLPTLNYGGAGFAPTSSSANIAYFAPTISSGALTITSTAGQQFNDFSTVQTSPTGQTLITMGNYPVSTGTITAGSSRTARGFGSNVTVDVCSAAISPATGNCPAGQGGVDGLSASSFVARDGGGASVGILSFAGSATQGRYSLTITPSAVTLDLVNLNADLDAPVDYLNKTGVTLTFVNGVATLTTSIDIAGDYLCFSTTQGGACSNNTSFSSDNDTTLYVVAKNNDNNTVASGADAARTVTVNVGGGPAGELGSTTGIASVNGSPLGTPASQTSITLSAGSGVFTFHGKTITGATPYNLTAATISPVVFPQTGPTGNPGHQSMSVAVTTGAATTLTLSPSVTTAPAGQVITLTASISDAAGNAITSGSYQVNFSATGTAFSFGATQVTTTNGQAATTVTALSAGDIIVTAASSALSPSVPSAPLTLSFTPGTTNSLVVTNVTAPSSTSTNGTLTVQVWDSNGNLRTTDNSTQLTLTAANANGNTNTLPDFVAATTGSIVADNSTSSLRSKTVQVAGGQAVLTWNSRVAGTVNFVATVVGDTSKSVNTTASVSAGTVTGILAVLPGETLQAGSPTGKAGTAPTEVSRGASLSVTVYAVDAYYNVSTSATATGTISSTQDPTAFSGSFSVSAGVANTAIVPGVTGSNTYSANALGYTASFTLNVTGTVSNPADVPGLPGSGVNIAGGDGTGDQTVVLTVDDTYVCNPLICSEGGARGASAKQVTLKVISAPASDPNDPSTQPKVGQPSYITVFIPDKTGNGAVGLEVKLVVTEVPAAREASALAVNQVIPSVLGAGAKTGPDGIMRFEVGSLASAGTTAYQVKLVVAGVEYDYGTAVRLTLNGDDAAPTVNINTLTVGNGNADGCSISGDTASLNANTTAGACLVSGDMVELNKPLTFQIRVIDQKGTAATPSGFLATGVTVLVDGADAGDTVTCPNLPANLAGTTDAQRSAEYVCTITIPAAMFTQSGQKRTITIRVADASGNTTGDTTIDVVVAGGSTINSVVNAPNPFNPMVQSTKITFQVTGAGAGHIEIYSLAGFIIRRIPVNVTNAGYHEVVWNGRDNGNRIVANGIYPYRVILTVNGARVVGKGKIAIIK